MGGKSSIHQLPNDIQDAVNKAIKENCATIDDIVNLIDSLGGIASRSAVGRYVKNANDKMEEFRQAQEMANIWIDKLGDDPDSDVGRLLSQMLRTVAFKTIGNLGEDDQDVAPREIMCLAKSIQHLASADKITADRILAIRKQVAKEAAEKIDEVLVTNGISQDSVNDIKKRFLEIF